MGRRVQVEESGGGENGEGGGGAGGEVVEKSRRKAGRELGSEVAAVAEAFSAASAVGIRSNRSRLTMYSPLVEFEDSFFRFFNQLRWLN